MADRQGTLRSIQVLRAVAASMVVVFHCHSGGLQLSSGPQVGLSLLNSGVDIFFVLSGLVMYLSTNRNRSEKEFLKARIVRIVPIYWIGTLLMSLLLAAQGMAPGQLEILLSLLFVPYGDIQGEMAPVLGVGWTLTYEMFFYIIFALTLWLERRRQIVTIVVVFGALVALRPVVGHWSAIGLRLTSPLLFEFVFGILIGVAIPRFSKIPVWVGAMASVVGFALIPLIAVLPFELPRTIAYGIPAAIVVGGAVCAENFFRSAFWRPVQFVGDASYSLYLFHIFVIIAMKPSLDADKTGIATLIAFTACIVVSSLIFVIVERPLLSTSRRLLPS